MDDLSAADIVSGLITRTVGSKVIYFPSLPSTMQAAREQVQKGTIEGTVIVSSEQTSGRGRFTRQWLSPPGSISLSIILRPDFAWLPFIIMLSAVAVARAIEDVTGLKTQLKWPNDVLVRGKKVCGILTESSLKDSQIEYVVSGIGINVNMNLVDYPEISGIATSLSDELDSDISILELLHSLLKEMDELYGTLPDGETVFMEWRQRMAMLGKKVQVISGQDSYEGIAEDVEREGSLLLRLTNGLAQHVTAGDVSLRMA